MTSTSPSGGIRVITFNIGGDQPPLKQRHPDNILHWYGQNLLCQADIVFLQEVEYSDWAKVLADSAGLPYQYADGTRCQNGVLIFGNCVFGYWFPDVAILSRSPLTQTSYTYITDRNIKLLDARVEIDGLSYRLLATHFNTGSDPSSIQNRVGAANIILGRLEGETSSIILGGDFNSTPTSQEYALLTQIGKLTDVYVAASQGFLPTSPPQPIPCDPPSEAPDARAGDWVFYRGPYTVSSYQGRLRSDPSDQFCILITLGHPQVPLFGTPNFDKLPVKDAIKIAEKWGISIEETRDLLDGNVDVPTVVDQLPDPGTLVSPGTTIQVTVAKPPGSHINTPGKPGPKYPF